MTKDHKYIGVNIPRYGVERKITGKELFAADIRMQNCLSLSVLRSDRSHAIIKSVDICEAVNIPGCVAVFTAKDIPGKNRFGIINKDQRLLCDDKVRFIGDPVALVAAEDPESAAKAVTAVKVHYEDLPAIFDPEESLRPGAINIHEHGNLLGRRVIKKGSPEEAFKHADIVIERVYTTSLVEHAYLEPDSGLAYIDENGAIVVHASTQNPHYDQKDVADLLGLDLERVRIKQCATGGGFGSKLDLNAQGYVGLAAYMLKRPARMVYSREEAFLCTSKRHPLKIEYKSAAAKNGRLLAADVRILGDTGAYASYGLAVVSRSAIHATGPYEVPNVHLESTFVYTNNPIAGAMRGFGVPQVAFAHESQMDLLAEALKISPLEIRRINCYRIGSITPTGQELTAGVGINQTIDAVAPFYLEDHAKPTSRFVRRGSGIGSMVYGIGNTGMQNPSTAQAELGRDGRVTIFTGAADIGQGSTTVLSQIAAEELNLDPNYLNLVVADTALTTSAGATSASRQTYISGNAVLDAVGKLKDVILTEAAMILHTDKSQLELFDGTVRRPGHPTDVLTFEQIAARAHKTGIPMKWSGYFDPESTPLDSETGQGKPYGAYAFATHVADVEVDLLTGEVKVLRIVAAHDVGKAINPTNVRGQILSGMAMGMGFAVMEEFIPGDTESLKDYHIVTCTDMPETVSIIIEDPEPTGPFGAKGVGEPALIPTAPAILNAIADALGVRIYDLPANLERVMKAAMPARSKVL
jgi:nicotinate dehydrogenase large molybdopterin subunit